MDDKNAAELLWQEFESAKQALKDVLVERFLPLFPDLEQLFDMLPLEDIASLLLKRKEEELLYFMQFGNFVPDALPPALHELGVSFKHYQSIQEKVISDQLAAFELTEEPKQMPKIKLKPNWEPLNKEAYSAAGEMWLSRSRHNWSLGARKTKLDDMFFLIFYLLV